MVAAAAAVAAVIAAAVVVDCGDGCGDCGGCGTRTVCHRVWVPEETTKEVAVHRRTSESPKRCPTPTPFASTSDEERTRTVKKCTYCTSVNEDEERTRTVKVFDKTPHSEEQKTPHGEGLQVRRTKLAPREYKVCRNETEQQRKGSAVHGLPAGRADARPTRSPATSASLKRRPSRSTCAFPHDTEEVEVQRVPHGRQGG